MRDSSRICFFCNKEIKGKKTLEHIIPNALLGHLGIKEEFISGNTGNAETQYSRLKVPAHSSCNSGFGSKYESEVIDLLENLDDLYEILINEDERKIDILTPDKSDTSLLTTWLLKIYYGVFYNDFLKTDDLDWKKNCESIIQSHNFDLIRKSYQKNIGFSLPSSLYCFKSKNEGFDFRTFVEPQAILLKIKSLTFIVCVCDGFLTKQYLSDNALKHLREELYRLDTTYDDFPLHLYAFSEILTILKCIPKSPSFAYSENKIVNMSLMTLAKDPENYYKIDQEKFISTRQVMRALLNIE